MDIAAQLKPIAEHLGLETLELDDRDSCSLDFDQQFAISLELDEDGETLHLSAALGAAPADLIDQLACFAAMLDANLFGRGTGGASLAYHADSGTLMLSRACFLTASDPDALVRAFSGFVSATEVWKARVDAEFWRSPDDEEPGDTPPAGDATPTLIKV